MSFFSVPTGDVEDGVVGGERAVLPALPLPVDHDLHDLCPQGDVGGVDGHAGGGAVARLGVLTWYTHTHALQQGVMFWYDTMSYHKMYCVV